MLADDNHVTGDMEGALLSRALREFDAEGDDCLGPVNATEAPRPRVPR